MEAGLEVGLQVGVLVVPVAQLEMRVQTVVGCHEETPAPGARRRSALTGGIRGLGGSGLVVECFAEEAGGH